MSVTGPTSDNNHQALLPIQRGQWITILGPPIWLWATMDMASGECLVPATTHKHHNTNQNKDHALLGLVSLGRLLTRSALCPILR